MSVGGIQGGNPPPMMDPSATTAGPREAQGAPGAARLDPEQMRNILREIQALSAGCGDGPAPAGAPALPPPVQTFSAEDAVLLLGSLQNKLTDSQLQVASRGVKLDAQKKEQLHQEAVLKLQTAAAKANQANATGIVLKVLGIAAKVGAVVGGATLVAAGAAVCAGTAGIGTVAGVAMMLLGGAVMGMAMMDLTLSVAGEISQAFGGPDLSPTALMSKLVAETLKACGVSEEHAEIAGMVVTAVVQVTIAVLVGATCLGLSLFTGGLSLAGTAASIAQAANAMSAIANLVSGGASIVSGLMTIDKSVMNYEADMARADKFDIDRMIVKLQEVMQAERDRIEELVKGMGEAMARISSMIAGSGDTRMQIARRMV